MTWRFKERPGYFGKRKADKFSAYDRRFGKGNWRIMWMWGERVLEWLMAVQLYEDAYYHYLLSHPDFLDDLVQNTREVYDNARSNVQSGLDYAMQETPATHLQDISVRRCLIRLGRWFEGDQLIQIRHNSKSPLGQTLSPGRVPFHLSRMIRDPPLRGWWDDGTVEQFYQSNKIIEIKALRLEDF